MPEPPPLAHPSRCRASHHGASDAPGNTGSAARHVLISTGSVRWLWCCSCSLRSASCSAMRCCGRTTIKPRSAYSSLQGSVEDALNRDMLRQRELFESVSYLAESRTALPHAQLHRGINLALHLSFAALLMLSLLRTLQLKGAFAASLVFAVHPAVIQTLFWPGYRNELFGLVLILAALNCGVRSRNGLNTCYAYPSLCWLAWCMRLVLFIPVILGLVVALQKRDLQLTHYNHVLSLSASRCLPAHGYISAPCRQTTRRFPSIRRSIMRHRTINFYYKQTLIGRCTDAVLSLQQRGGGAQQPCLEPAALLLRPALLCLGLVPLAHHLESRIASRPDCLRLLAPAGNQQPWAQSRRQPGSHDIWTVYRTAPLDRSHCRRIPQPG